MRFRDAIIAIAEPMFKEITLPVQAALMRHIALELAERTHHPRLLCKTHHGVEMIRHEEQQMQPPMSALFIENNCVMNRGSGFGMTELIGAARLCTDRDEINRAILNPRRPPMWQLLTFRQHDNILAEIFYAR